MNDGILNAGDRVNSSINIGSINSGVPHVVAMVDQVDAVDVVGLGREIRYHQAFAPAGTNANFVERLSKHAIKIRTYERGVEDETLACGTGAIASALICAWRYEMPSPINVKTRSDALLTIHFDEIDGRFDQIHMEGDARIIYTGELQPDAWQ